MRLVLIYIISLFAPLHAVAQVFPLKVSDKGNYLVTKKGVPFLVNACTLSTSHLSREDLVNFLNNRYNYGFNAILVSIAFEGINFDNREIKVKEFLKQIKILPILIREAALRDMSVIISPEIDSALQKASSKNKELYFNLLNKKVHFGNNLILLFKKAEQDSSYCNNAILQLNSKHLVAFKTSSSLTTKEGTEDFGKIEFFSRLSSFNVNAHYPFIITYSPNIENDSTAFIARKTAYSGILNGTCGFVFNQVSPGKEVNKWRAYNPVFRQLKQLKALMDSLQWYNLMPAKENVSINNPLSNNVYDIAIRPDSSLSIIYIPYNCTFSVDLSFLKTPLKLTWISSASNKTYHTTISSDPHKQLFMPPLSNSKRNDWVLIISTDIPINKH